MNERMYVDFHVLQIVPPSCINRDDTGSPKTAIYGGTMRARVSSQAWKRAMRLMFRDLFGTDQLGYRTRNTVTLVAEQVLALDPGMDAEKAEKLSAEILELTGVKSEKGKDVLFFISSKQIVKLARLALEYGNVADKEKKNAKSEKKNAKSETVKKIKDSAIKAVSEEPGIDMLLFGRMAAGNPSLNYDAAAQVAHSISTHTVSNEYDYFTAVDDCGEEDNAGAAHIDTIEYNSSTLYRYATVNVAELAKNLNTEELCSTIRGFAEAFILSMPTGRQNSFANRTVPNLVYVTVRRDQPVNLVGAFERPVAAGDDGYADRSARALFGYAGKVYDDFVPGPEKAWVIGGNEDYSPAEKTNLKGLLAGLDEAVREYSPKEG